MERPNAIVHMTFGGFLVGGALGAIYGMIVLAGLMLMDWGYWTGGEFIFAAGLGGAIGAPLGFALGFLSGFAMDWVVRRMDYPYSDDSIRRLRQQTHLMLVILAGVGAVLGLGRLFMEGDVAAMLFFVLTPAVISTLSAMWVADRYIKQLANWGRAKQKVA